MEPVVIATWPFGRTAVEVASKLLAAGKPPLDAALAGAQAVEDDPKVHSVGFSGIGNSIGTVSLDACVMDGKTLDCGSVAAVENIRHVAAWREVMEKTPHVMLVGEGAEWFALQNGFPLETLLTPESVTEWEKNRPRKKNEPKGHDTVTVLAHDGKGHLGGVCTTSGLSYKLPGRVGDSPLIGAGLVRRRPGRCGGGDRRRRGDHSHRRALVHRRADAGRQVAAGGVRAGVKRVNAAAVRRGVHPAQVAFLALDPKGEVGAAATQRTNFQFAVARGGKVEMLKAKEY